MDYVRLVRSDHTTGNQRRLGEVTKTGFGHARRLLVEPPGITASTRDRQDARRAPGRATCVGACVRRTAPQRRRRT